MFYFFETMATNIVIRKS